MTIANHERSLSELEALVERPPVPQADDVARALARFLVVRTCGFLEQVVDDCCSAYLTSKASPRAGEFGKSWLGRGSNPTPDRLRRLVGRFDREWEAELEQLFDAEDERISRELYFLVDRRNKIAHGLSEGIGARKALDLLVPAREVTDWFILRFDPR